MSTIAFFPLKFKSHLLYHYNSPYFLLPSPTFTVGRVGDDGVCEGGGKKSFYIDFFKRRGTIKKETFYEQKNTASFSRTDWTTPPPGSIVLFVGKFPLLTQRLDLFGRAVFFLQTFFTKLSNLFQNTRHTTLSRLCHSAKTSHAGIRKTRKPESEKSKLRETCSENPIENKGW